MSNEHVLSGLIAKRSELAGKIEALQKELRELVAAIDHIDASIRVFDPTVDLEDIQPRLPPRHSAFRGEISRLALNALRKMGRPMGVHELTLQIVTARGLDPADKSIVRLMSHRVGACLRNQRKKGLVRLRRGVDSPIGTWEIVR
jgi:hypothetical protein